MCEGGGLGTRPMPAALMRPDLKCCTYTPNFPNYQVGALLAADGPDADVAREQILRRLEGGREVTPMGLGVPPARQGVDAAHVSQPGLYEVQRCPHLVLSDEHGGAACAVWAHRDAVCSTWWCRYERGAAGARFWWSLRYLLHGVEHALALWCCMEDGLHTDQLILAMSQDGVPKGTGIGPEVERGGFWGALAGQEAAFYRRCWERVRDLSWEEVLRISGADVQALAMHVRTAEQRVEAPIPERLRVGSYTVIAMQGDDAAAQTFSNFDPIGIPVELLSALHRFDGRTAAEVEAELAELGLPINQHKLRELVDYGVLVEAPAEG